MGWIQKYDIDDEPLPMEIVSSEEFESSAELEEVDPRHEGKDERDPEA
jgi:hypothetical protein